MCNGKDPLLPATSKDINKFQLTQMKSEVKFLLNIHRKNLSQSRIVLYNNVSLIFYRTAY